MEPSYLERVPSGPLGGIVQRVWWLDVPVRERFERIVPLPSIHVIVNLSPEPYRVLARGRERVGDAFATGFVSGLQVDYLLNENPSRIRHVGAAIAPWAAGALGMDAPAIARRVRDSADLLPALSRLDPELHGDAALDRWEELLQASLVPGWQPDRRIVAAVSTVLEDPWVRVAALASAAGMTPKAFSEAFRRACGVTPKLFAEVVRHQVFLGSLPTDGELPPWAELIANHGYVDQPHFIREFRRFTGMTPGEYVEHRRRFGPGDPSFLELDETFLPREATDAG